MACNGNSPVMSTTCGPISKKPLFTLFRCVSAGARGSRPMKQWPLAARSFRRPSAWKGSLSMTGKHYLLADSEATFAESILKLLHDGSMRLRIAADARNLVERNFSFRAVGDAFEKICVAALEAAIKRLVIADSCLTVTKGDNACSSGAGTLTARPWRTPGCGMSAA